MSIVRESINFERGLEPKKSMDIGKSKLDRELIEKTDWAIDILKHQHIYDILQNKQQGSWPYRAISVRGFFTEYNPTQEKALREMIQALDKIESLKPNK